MFRPLYTVHTNTQYPKVGMLGLLYCLGFASISVAVGAGGAPLLGLTMLTSPLPPVPLQFMPLFTEKPNKTLIRVVKGTESRKRERERVERPQIERKCKIYRSLLSGRADRFSSSFSRLLVVLAKELAGACPMDLTHFLSLYKIGNLAPSSFCWSPRLVLLVIVIFFLFCVL